MNFAWYDFVGFTGTLMILAAFAAQQMGKMRGDGAAYQLLNLFGAGCILVEGVLVEEDPDRVAEVFDRLKQELCFTHQRRQLGLDTGRGHQFLQAFQPGTALATERDGVGLPRGQTIDKGMAGQWGTRLVVVAGGHAVMFIDRHVL